MKPQFLVAVPLILLLARAWQVFGGMAISTGAQLFFARYHFGSTVMHDYFALLLHPSRWIDIAELDLAAIQMHSLRSFWLLLIPAPALALALYVLSSIVVLAMAAAIWKSASPLALRFSALTLTAVLVNPHLFVYDLLVLAPVLLMLVDWALTNPREPHSLTLRLLLYLAFVLPLFGPLSRWTHVQLSVIAMVAILWTLHRCLTPGYQLASDESAVV